MALLPGPGGNPGGGGFPPSGPAGGDLRGTYPNPTVGHFTLDTNADANNFEIDNLILPLNVDLFFATTGNDANPGTLAQPLLTLAEGLRRVGHGWRGSCKFTFANGTYPLGADQVLLIRQGVGQQAQPMQWLAGNADSGLGPRTASGGTAGAGATFGTLVDSVGGLTVNAHVGRTVRFTGGLPASLVGRRYRILSNDATTFTLVGALAAAPTTSTYVVEDPGAIFSYTGNLSLASAGAILGMQNIRWSGPGGTSLVQIFNTTLATDNCQFNGWGTGGFQLRALSAVLSITAVLPIPSLGIVQVVGPYFAPTTNGSTITTLATCTENVSRAFYNGAAHDTEQAGTFFQVTDSAFTQAAWLRLIGANCASLARCRFQTVTPVPASAAFIGCSGAAVVAGKGTFLEVVQVDVSNTPATTAPGDAYLIADRSNADFSSATGTGNAGIGVRVSHLSAIRNGGSNTVTGAGGDVKIGGNAVSTWAGLGQQTDIAAAAPELCLASA